MQVHAVQSTSLRRFVLVPLGYSFVRWSALTPRYKDKSGAKCHEQRLALYDDKSEKCHGQEPRCHTGHYET